mgnify:CR=1 FL=1|jgi:hypothetical protein
MCEISPDNGNGNVAASPFSSAQGAADAAQTAQEGACFLAEFWVEQGVCFTSGHIVHALREARGRSLMVNQRPTGQALQDYFTSGDLPSFDDGLGGDGERPVRKLRSTSRTDTRTPVGTEVFVYGPSEDDIDCFEFELNIAEAPLVDDGQGGTTSPAAALLNATPNLAAGAPGSSVIPPVQPSGTVATAHGKMVPGTPLAVIHTRGKGQVRLTIPRIAFEALAFETGDPITGGQPLYVADNGGVVTVCQDQANNNGTAYNPTTDRLRLHLPVTLPLTVGTEFSIVVGTDGLTIDLNDPRP